MSSYRKKRRPPGTERTEQQNLLTETQYANPGVQRDLSSNQLTSGLPYQRPVEPEDVDRLIAKWDDRLLTPLVVSFRDGKFNVVDGQHRIAAMRKMADGGNVTVPCLIYTGLSYEQEGRTVFQAGSVQRPAAALPCHKSPAGVRHGCGGAGNQATCGGGGLCVGAG